MVHSDRWLLSLWQSMCNISSLYEENTGHFGCIHAGACGAHRPAQVKSGEASMNLNGTVSVGYSDDYSNSARF